MAEQLANLSKSEPKEIQTFTFDVSNVPVQDKWGNVYSSPTKTYTINTNLTNKKVFVQYVPTSETCWLTIDAIRNNLIHIIYIGPTSRTTSGKLHVMVTD